MVYGVIVMSRVYNIPTSARQEAHPDSLPTSQQQVFLRFSNGPCLRSSNRPCLHSSNRPCLRLSNRPRLRLSNRHYQELGLNQSSSTG